MIHQQVTANIDTSNIFKGKCPGTGYS